MFQVLGKKQNRSQWESEIERNHPESVKDCGLRKGQRAETETEISVKDISTPSKRQTAASKASRGLQRVRSSPTS